MTGNPEVILKSWKRGNGKLTHYPRLTGAAPPARDKLMFPTVSLWFLF
jgi:hypothetical protein